jgi:hypothetical protein
MSDLVRSIDVGWLGIGITVVVGALGTWLAYRLGLRVRPGFAFAQDGLELLSGGMPVLPSQVTVLFSERPIPRLMKSKVIVWNCGKAVLRGEDVVEPLQVALREGGEILTVDVSSQRPASALTCTRPTPSAATVAFSYLEAGEGGLTEILHTAEKPIVDVTGVIRGLPEGPQNKGDVWQNLKTVSVRAHALWH